MPAFIDITGNKYNRLTVLNRVDGKYGKPSWLCKCECGNFCTVVGQYLKSGKTKSCGCYQKEYTRETHLMRKYKLPIERYNQMLVEQDNKCFICGYEFGQVKGDTYVDHCHITKQVRGLLCQNCNTGLGSFKDNTDALQKAIEYLKRI